MTPQIREVTRAEDFGALEPMVVEYLRIITNELQTHHGVVMDPTVLAAGTMATPEKYVPPRGRTFVAEDGGAFLGMGFLRPLDGTDYEIKRLYVRPEARGTGLGRTLLYRVMDAARALGGRRLFLDTLGTLTPAIRLYEAEGFRFTDPYPGSEVAVIEDIRPHAVFMVSDLAPQGHRSHR